MRENAQLRARNRALTEHLALAMAEIQRLALEDHRLREQLDARGAVPVLRPRPTRGRHPAG
ncbi:hypothetical protein [Amycolatopsis sp. NPDC004625]|uniref:hypothetical protein n=1 Tax=Amycolatopsis sp. NPDC004625 TaxID=3154670 RepID=UPI0033AA948E